MRRAATCLMLGIVGLLLLTVGGCGPATTRSGSTTIGAPATGPTPKLNTARVPPS